MTHNVFGGKLNLTQHKTVALCHFWTTYYNSTMH